uniref:Gag-Pol polyprotein n=1 Tax=Tanacetum cinerariifolium TaxID=118510 RepID=A0A6L2JHY3_TANCI|nr:hypothetical protein [Tanacetum cinerariifolium]
MPNPEDITDPIAVMNMALVLMAKAFKLNYSTPIHNNQRISSNPFNRQIAQPGNQVVQNLGAQNVENQNGVIVVLGIANQNKNGNVVAIRAKGNENGNNELQLQAEEFDLIAVEVDLDEIEKVNANYILMANLQQTSTSGTQSDKAPVYDSDSSAEYNELLEPIPEPRQVLQNNSNVTSLVSSVEQGGRIVEQHPTNVEETQAAKFVQDFQSLANEADEPLSKHKALELEIERLFRAFINQDIMSIVQNNSVVDTSNLQTELERTKERFENYIIKEDNEYAKLWNDWYKKCEECKYDKISYDKGYNDMQQKIKWLQAQLGDQKGKSKDTQCISDTLDPLPQKLENENIELEFQVQNYEKENAHLKTAYKNLFDSINVTRA